MPSLNNKRVLLVDDEESVRLVIAMLLHGLGVTVFTAANGTEALNLYRSESFDLVLTDYGMPQMRGDELARSIKTINPAQRVIVITGSVETVCEHGLPPCFDGIIPKPCSLNQLIDALNGKTASVASLRRLAA